MTDELIVRGQLTQALSGALHRSNQGLRAVPELLRAAILERAWEKRVIVETGEVFEGFPSFDAWVEAAAPKGLGADITLIKRIMADDAEAKDLLDRARQNPVGNPTFSQPDRIAIPYNIRNSNEAPAGTSSDYALRRLRKDRPDLHAQVIAGEMSPHAAMVKAGFMRRKVIIPITDDMMAAAQTLERQLTRAQSNALWEAMLHIEQMKRRSVDADPVDDGE